MKEYFVGLDCGTNSVGWAVTDSDYRVSRAKGKSLWGVRLFDEADTAADRRVARSSRRRLRRAKSRIKLLQQLFSEEIVKVDPDFYIRLRESFFLEEDKRGLYQNNKNTLFNDSGFNDKDYHKKYPTIWHLRKAILNSDKNEHFDIRLYYLAIEHILKHRGHFLYDGKMKSNGDNFKQLYQDLTDACEEYGFAVSSQNMAEVEKTIKDKRLGIRDKGRKLAEILFIESEEDGINKRCEEFAKLIAGSKVSLDKIFDRDAEEEYKISFNEGVFEDKIPEIEQNFGSENTELIILAKRFYDFGILSKLLGSNDSISSAMVENYEKHNEDLKLLKTLFKQILTPEEYKDFFSKTKCDKKDTVNYPAYIGATYTEDRNGRKSYFKCQQEDLNKEIKKILDAHNVNDWQLYERLEKNELLPKQKGQAKGTIPQQLHHNELEKILEKLAEDYPSFAAQNPNESEEYNTHCKKIERLHDFRIPYYCGPLVKRKYDAKGNDVGGKSEFSWADEEINELVRPWNFNDLVNRDALASNFIRRMTNQCTYLIGEDVLPKSSLIYQKYMLLNELNNLKINGKRISDVALKQDIYRGAFEFNDEQLQGNITLKKLKSWMVAHSKIEVDDELTGTSETKILPRLSTETHFEKIIPGFKQKYNAQILEDAVEYITILGEEKEMLQRKLAELFPDCDEKQIRKLSKLKFTDWGRFSKKFLTEIKVLYDGQENQSILDVLWNTNQNLMEIIKTDGSPFIEAIDEFNKPKLPEKGRITYQDVKNLYCSPAVKRTVWQTIKIVNEIAKVQKCAPKKIFIEVTREENDKNKKGYTLARRNQLLNIYKDIKRGNPEIQDLYDELDGKQDRDLQNQKLFLYFSQCGHCAYCNKSINIEDLTTEAYDIDHIYPRSKTKDDSITRNKVLVCAGCNRTKSDIYPLAEDWRNRMHRIWQIWCASGLITKEKYERLIRVTPLTADELGEFVARQIVETSQSVKAIRDLLQRAYPDSDVVLVKAGQVSEFRHYFGYDQKDKEGRVYKEGNPAFVKVRSLNDFHHAKDAYLNIVVGNIMHETFTSNPAKWIKSNKDNYSINNHVLYRAVEINSKGFNPMPVKGWKYKESIDLISKQIARNDILWTRMNYVESSEISDLNIVGKAEDVGNTFQIKTSDSRLKVEKYGGYNSAKNSHFVLIECLSKRGEKQRRLVPVPIMWREKQEEYLNNTYGECKIIIPKIGYKSLFKINGFPLHISRKDCDTANGFYHAVQLCLAPELASYMKRVESVVDKDTEMRGRYEIDEKRDGVSSEKNRKMYEALIEKLTILGKMPGFSSAMQSIEEYKNGFHDLSFKEQLAILVELLKIFSCNATTANLLKYIPRSGTIGKGKFNNDMLSYDSALLINQSITGIFEEEIDLKTCEAQK